MADAERYVYAAGLTRYYGVRVQDAEQRHLVMPKSYFDAGVWELLDRLEMSDWRVFLSE